MADDGGIWIKASASAGATASAWVKTANGWEEVAAGGSGTPGRPIILDQAGAEIVRFQPPSESGNSDIISYTAQSTPPAELRVQFSDIDTIGYGEVYFIDADESQQYTISIRAVNNQGAGSPATTDSFSPIIPYNNATGGVITVVDDYWNDGSKEKWRYHRFTSANNSQPSGKFTVTKSRLPFRLLMLGGGGDGGRGNGTNGGGGGASGAMMISDEYYGFDEKEHTVYVSPGRTSSYISGTSPTLVALGGGSGGDAGQSGFSPGGGGGGPSRPGGDANPAGSNGVGPAEGGPGYGAYSGAGGGYISPSSTYPWNAASGYQSNIMGNANKQRHGAGGGGASQNLRGNGGSGGGGSGGTATSGAYSATTETGSGGGGSFTSSAGGSGASGVCYIAYRIGTTTRHEMLELERQRELTDAAYQRGFEEGSHETHEAYAAMSEPEE